MEISVTVKRSENWVKARRIETGENVPAELKVDIETTDFSPTTRKLLLTYTDSYQDLDRIYFDSSYSPARASCYGWVCIKIDSDTPTPAEIDQAILGAFAEIEGKRVEWEVEQERRRQVEELKAEQKKQRENELEKARELLKDELSRLEKVEAKLELLSEFVGEIPDDACRGALKSLHRKRSGSSLADLQNEVENAAVKYVVFDSDNDPDDGQE